tara:strand:+ start:929 stop:1480 length:552 start_codon:yes stop_codon:yes gene_type:complete
MESNKIQIIDNYLSHDEFERVSNFMLGEQMKWTYLGNYGGNYPLMERVFYHEERGQERVGRSFILDESMTHLFPLLRKIDPLVLLRIRANCNWRTNPNDMQQRGWHTDFPKSVHATTSIFYINDNDGCTVFKDDDTICESKANRLLTFPSTMGHAATPFTNTERRILININYHGGKGVIKTSN